MSQQFLRQDLSQIGRPERSKTPVFTHLPSAGVIDVCHRPDSYLASGAASPAGLPPQTQCILTGLLSPSTLYRFKMFEIICIIFVNFGNRYILFKKQILARVQETIFLIKKCFIRTERKSSVLRVLVQAPAEHLPSM